MLKVNKDNGEYSLQDMVSPEDEKGGFLDTVFMDGKLLVDHCLEDIRARLIYDSMHNL